MSSWEKARELYEELLALAKKHDIAIIVSTQKLLSPTPAPTPHSIIVYDYSDVLEAEKAVRGKSSG